MNKFFMKESESILVVGSTGQDGTLLCESLMRKGKAVIGTSRNKATDKADWPIFKLNYLDRSMVENFLNSHNFTEIYFLGAQSSVGKSFDEPHDTFYSNTIPILNVLDWIKNNSPQTKFFHASSGEIFGSRKSGASELSCYYPLSPYAVSKLAATELVKNYRMAYGLFAVNGILFNHESYLRDERFVTGKIVNSAIRIKLKLQDKLYLGNIEIERDWGSAEDYVEAMQLMMKSNINDDFVIATGKKTSLKCFCDLVFAELGMNSLDFIEADNEKFRPLDLKTSFGDPDKIYRQLNWKAKTSIEELISNWVGKALAENNKKI
jgi:GDPmannose 4,6-dehydratase